MPGFAGYTMANELLDFFYRGVAISVGGTLYLRLLTAPSSRDGGGTETNYGGYARLALPRSAAVFTSAAATGQLRNGVTLSFPTVTAPGNGLFVAFDVVDTPSGAFTKVYNGGPISPPRAEVVGRAPVFRVGALLLSF